MFGLLADQGVGSLPWSPLAKGRLARPWGEQTARSETDNVARWVLPHDDKPIADAVQAIAGERGVPMAQVALAWVLKNPVVMRRSSDQRGPPPHGRRRRARHPAHRRGSKAARGALHAADADRLRVKP